jgi:hypothetical protein
MGGKTGIAGTVHIGRLSSTDNDNTAFNVRNRVGVSRFFVDAAGGNVGIGSTSPSARLDLGGGNIRMGWEVPYSNSALASNVANGTWTAYIAVCTAGKKPLSAQCWTANNNSVAGTQINSSGQLSAGNYSGATTMILCTIICANIQ